jgi:hypothetical protein
VPAPNAHELSYAAGSMETTRGAWRLASRWATVGGCLGLAACAAHPPVLPLPASALAASRCDNRCAILSCPSGSRSVQSSDCAPRCEPEPLQRP